MPVGKTAITQRVIHETWQPFWIHYKVAGYTWKVSYYCGSSSWTGVELWVEAILTQSLQTKYKSIIIWENECQMFRKRKKGALPEMSWIAGCRSDFWWYLVLQIGRGSPLYLPGCLTHLSGLHSQTTTEEREEKREKKRSTTFWEDSNSSRL